MAVYTLNKFQWTSNQKPTFWGSQTFWGADSVKQKCFLKINDKNVKN